VNFAIVDANCLFAVLDASDQNHARCLAELERTDLRLVIPALCVAEVSYLAEKRLGSSVESQFLRSLSSFDVRAPEPDDWPRIAQLVAQYANFPLSGTDASVITLAERLSTDIIVTLDRRHFGAIKPLHAERLRLLPET
jgi:uncharacterized protein